MRSRLGQFSVDYAAGDLTPRQLRVATEVTERKLVDVESRLARIGSSNALTALMSAPDPGAAWIALDDINAQIKVVKTLGDVLVHRQRIGRRPSEASREKYLAWMERITSSIEIRWHEEPRFPVV